MNDTQRSIRREILERVFPDLRYGGDPDVERYFELRAAGRMLDALAVYTGRLKPRYPDDEKRVTLLKLYRLRSPAYHEFLEGLLMERADFIIARLKANIDALCGPLDGVPLKDTYAVLKAVERVARLLPGDEAAALAFTGSFEEYAKLLSYRREDMAKLAYLLSEFYRQAKLGEDEAPDFVELSRRETEAKRREAEERERQNFFDLSKIEFDEADVRRIEIPAGLERDEDRVLAYCHRYWAYAGDPGFERIVWLYSKKHGTRHYEVFKAIKTGRERKYPDDDILSLVATTIAERYSYTVQGDLYMQAAWRQIKASLYAKPEAAAPGAARDESGKQASARAGGAAPGSPAGKSGSPANSPAGAAETPAGGSTRVAAARPAGGSTAGAARTAVGTAAKADKPAARRPAASRAAAAARSPEPALRATAPAKPVSPAPARPRSTAAREPEAALTRAPTRRRRAALAPAAGRDDPALPPRVAGGSISDRIRKLSGKAYDVYREIFLAKLRPHIRFRLVKARTKASGGGELNRAENLVYEFMAGNYANPYMDWAASEHKATITELGFELPSLDGIIEDCYKTIAK